MRIFEVLIRAVLSHSLRLFLEVSGTHRVVLLNLAASISASLLLVYHVLLLWVLSLSLLNHMSCIGLLAFFKSSWLLYSGGGLVLTILELVSWSVGNIYCPLRFSGRLRLHHLLIVQALRKVGLVLLRHWSVRLVGGYLGSWVSLKCRLWILYLFLLGLAVDIWASWDLVGNWSLCLSRTELEASEVRIWLYCRVQGSFDFRMVVELPEDSRRLRSTSILVTLETLLGDVALVALMTPVWIPWALPGLLL